CPSVLRPFMEQRRAKSVLSKTRCVSFDTCLENFAKEEIDVMIRESLESLEKNFFRLSLVVSFLLHSIIFMIVFYQNVRLPKEISRLSEQIISYLVRVPASTITVQLPIKESLPAPVSSLGMLSPKKEELKKKAVTQAKLIVDKTLIHSPIPNVQTQDGKVRKGQIAISLLESAAGTQPKNLKYHQQVRERIRKMAYMYLDDPRFQDGEVYLTFVVSATGVLKQVQVIPEKTQASDYARQAGLKSIKDSNPFPSFPADLKSSELIFNVVIDFDAN
ncbi:MAG: hypothetical protein NUV91_06760, partial [Candidatus Omnitrophica bacterium]|nr:hypothetical protein [Candidatus Omnitrophota bacterium]